MKERPNERIEYLSQSDHSGKCRFALFWLEDFHPSISLDQGRFKLKEISQCFFSDPRFYSFPRPEDASPVDIEIGLRMKEINHSLTDQKFK